MKYLKVIVVGLFGLYSLFFIAGSCLAPVMAGLGNYELSAKLTSLYMYSCHQRPDRGFWILGYPVALCCRCLGFYAGVFLSSIVLIMNKFKIHPVVLVIFILFVIADVLLNFVCNINTGNYVRFFAGIFMGILFIVILNVMFGRIKKRKRLD